MKEFLKSLLASVLGTFLAGALCAFLLLVLMSFAFYNDLNRLFTG